eukprot:GEMP01042750.1.p1 GENE.GEMP01042750.1~~GEMP01042750.1.p1  ORF type:complete len:410 (+),score=86.24 GEMP01042750.1:42-1271(+)
MVSAILALLGTACAEIVIDAMKHDVQEITKLNFDSVIGKFRDSSVSSVILFDENTDDEMFTKYNTAAGALKGMVKVAALDCSKGADASAFCQKEAGGTPLPVIRIYPQNPQPAYNFQGTVEKLNNHLSKRIPDFTKVLNDDDFDAWVTTDPSKPKVILFSEKESVPTILKALSSETVFRRTVNFALMSSKNDKTHKKMKVKNMPAILMIRGTKAEIKEWYKGDLKYEDIKNWVNLYSESGMGDAVHSGSGATTVEESKPWLVAEIPELTGKSHQDICFKGEGLCLIYLNKGPIIDEKVLDLLTSLKSKFTSHVADRGAKWKWMWVDLELEKNFFELFGEPELPGVVVFNPHKRLRWTKQESGPATESSINGLLDKILGGDARFTIVKGQKLPSWAVREAPEKKGKKDEL